MSSILLSNPFPAPPPPPAAAPVAPVQSGGAASTSGDAASFSGSGAGSSRQADTVALFKSKDSAKWARPSDATGGSVIGAQAQSSAPTSVIEDAPLGPDLPAVEMPDPLPTSPFLKPNNFVG